MQVFNADRAASMVPVWQMSFFHDSDIITVRVCSSEFPLVVAHRLMYNVLLGLEATNPWASLDLWASPKFIKVDANGVALLGAPKQHSSKRHCWRTKSVPLSYSHHWSHWHLQGNNQDPKIQERQETEKSWSAPPLKNQCSRSKILPHQDKTLTNKSSQGHE